VQKVEKLVNKDQKKYHPTNHRPVRPLKWNMPANYKGGLKHAADLHKVCS